MDKFNNLASIRKSDMVISSKGRTTIPCVYACVCVCVEVFVCGGQNRHRSRFTAVVWCRARGSAIVRARRARGRPVSVIGGHQVALPTKAVCVTFSPNNIFHSAHSIKNHSRTSSILSRRATLLVQYECYCCITFIFCICIGGYRADLQ